jgi:hypothetical protein
MGKGFKDKSSGEMVHILGFYSRDLSVFLLIIVLVWHFSSSALAYFILLQINTTERRKCHTVELFVQWKMNEKYSLYIPLYMCPTILYHYLCVLILFCTTIYVSSYYFVPVYMCPRTKIYDSRLHLREGNWHPKLEVLCPPPSFLDHPTPWLDV